MNTNRNQSKVIEKIKKCLRLAASASGNEAATALRQAQKLMEKHNVNHAAIEMSDVSTSQCSGVNAKKPPKWHQMLVSLISHAFGVEMLYMVGRSANVEFIGIDPQPEIAGYAYNVLNRLIVKARAEHVTKQKRVKRSTKIRRGDLFAEYWVLGASRAVTEFAQTTAQKALVRKYIAEKHTGLVATKAKIHKARASDGRSLNEGYAQGKKTQLHHGMGESAQIRLGAAHA